MANETNHLRARVEITARAKGLSLSEVASKMGKSPQALQAILRSGNPLYKTVSQMADALGVEPSEVMRPVTPQEYGEARMPTM